MTTKINVNLCKMPLEVIIKGQRVSFFSGVPKSGGGGGGGMGVWRKRVGVLSCDLHHLLLPLRPSGLGGTSYSLPPHSPHSP